jgi:hypothetical protein
MGNEQQQPLCASRSVSDVAKLAHFFIPPVHLTYWRPRAAERVQSRAGFLDIAVRHCSMPLNAASRSGIALPRQWAILQCVICPSQRATLPVSARNPP